MFEKDRVEKKEEEEEEEKEKKIEKRRQQDPTVRTCTCTLDCLILHYNFFKHFGAKED